MVIKSAFDSLVPGGYLEIQDIILPIRSIDDTLRGTALETWFDKLINAAANLGKYWDNSGNYVRYFKEAGFIDIVQKDFQWPLNTWPKGVRMKTLGRYLQEDMLRGLEAWSMAAMTRGGGLTKEQVMELNAEAQKDIVNKNIHAYLHM